MMRLEIPPEILKGLGRHMSRRRGQEGWVEKTGKQRKKWRGCWYVYRIINGVEKRTGPRRLILGNCSEMTKLEAKQALQRFIAESEGRIAPAPENITLEALWRRYANLKEASWSKVTADTLTSLFRTSVLPIIGASEVKTLTLDPLQQVLNRMAAAGRSLSAIQKARMHLKSLMEYAVDERLIETNPARGKKLVIPRKTRKPSGRFLSLDEVHKLLMSSDGMNHLILRLFLVCGFRPGELFVLRVNDVEPGRIRVDEAMKQAEKGVERLGDPKTESSRAYVSIPEDLEIELRAWMNGVTDTSRFLFATRQNTPIRPGNYLKRVLKPLAESVEIADITYQCLRRTCATYFRQNLKAAQSQLRHANPMVTANIYQKTISEDVRAAVRALDAEFCGSNGKETVQ